MQTAATARNNTNTVRGSLSYVDTLITNATAEGKDHIMVESNLVDDTMVSTLRTNGYTVTSINGTMSTYLRYKVSW
jgi:hypothetical protein